jgi:hypothetical protein
MRATRGSEDRQVSGQADENNRRNTDTDHSLVLDMERRSTTASA